MFKQTGIHRNLTKYILPALVFFIAPGTVTVHAADAVYCKQYANTALRQFAQAKEAGCKGLNYPVWSMDFDHHYGWCLTVQTSQAQAGTALRSRAFANCREVAARSVVTPIPIPQPQAPPVTPIPIPGTQAPAALPLPIPQPQLRSIDPGVGG